MGILFDQLEPFSKAYMEGVLRIRGIDAPSQEQIDSAAASLSAFVAELDRLPSDAPEQEWLGGHTPGLAAELFAFLFTQFGVAGFGRATDEQLEALEHWRMTGELPGIGASA